MRFDCGASLRTEVVVGSHRAAQPLGKGGDRKGLPVVIAGAGFAAACAALRLLAEGFRPVLLQSPRARDLGGVEILPAAMADQLALLGLGDMLARAGASLAEGVDVSWGRSDDGLHRYRTLHIDRLALRREAVAEAAARGAEIRSVAHLPALSATCSEWVDCAGQRFFAALDATGRRAANASAWRRVASYTPQLAIGSTISSLNAQTSASHLSGENPAPARSKSVVKAHI
jgi:hypothetical protein